MENALNNTERRSRVNTLFPAYSKTLNYYFDELTFVQGKYAVNPKQMKDYI